MTRPIPLLKVCGLRDTATASEIAALDIDYIGFMFAPSRRRVTAVEAGAMIAAIRSQGGNSRFVGVFVNPSIEELSAVMEIAPLDVIQLHGQEDAAMIRECRAAFAGVAVWKAIGVSDKDTEAAALQRLAPYAGLIDGLLLDAYDPKAHGGTGRTFRWETIPVYQAWTMGQGVPLFVAGGLHADNVRSLLDEYAADGVDVSSGVETDGVKDVDKIRTFVQRVKKS